jgi:hypothetical protein
MSRWTARLLLCVVLVSGFEPLALARASQPEAMHCLRKPAMHCHHAMAMGHTPQPPETSFRALDSCCQNHDCCRNLAIPRWARPQSELFSHRSLLTEQALPAPAAQLPPISPSDSDSARAPPRG